MEKKENTLSLFWYDLLEEMISYVLDRLYKYYDPEEDVFDTAQINKWLEGYIDEHSNYGRIDLHPLYYELIKSLDEPGYPPYDPTQDSPFESMLICLHEHDRDRFYDFNRAMNIIFAEDAFEPATILHKDAFVALFNEFILEFLNKNKQYTHIHNNNGSVGRKIKIEN